MNHTIKIVAGILMIVVGALVINDNPTASVIAFAAAALAFIPPIRRKEKRP